MLDVGGQFDWPGVPVDQSQRFCGRSLSPEFSSVSGDWVWYDSWSHMRVSPIEMRNLRTQDEAYVLTVRMWDGTRLSLVPRGR